MSAARIALPIGLLGAAAALGACRDEPPAETPRAPSTYVPERAAPAAVPPAKLAYVDVTRDAGIDFVHETGADGRKLLPETMGSGCAFFDYDSDGDPDLLFLTGVRWETEGDQPSMRLYRNDGDFRFADVTAEAGLDATAGFYGMGAAVADTDGDGDVDLFVSGVGGYLLLRNDGGRFTETATESGLVPGPWIAPDGREHGPFASSAAFLDYDLDGLPDLFVCHYVHWSIDTDVWSTMDGSTKTYAVPTQYPGESCRLWRNLGGNRFEDVTDRAGVRNDKGKSLGVAVVDLDGDAHPDLAVANDTQPNYLYRNRGDGTFEEIGVPAGVAYDSGGRARAGMGIDAAFLGEQGRLCLAYGNFSGEPVSVREQRGKVFVSAEDACGVARVTQTSLTFGLLFLDADLDGLTDLLLANGHIEPTIQKVHKDVAYEQPLQLLRGVPGGRFEDVSASLGPDFGTPRVHRGLAAADVDGDGDLDLAATVNGGAPVLLRCDLEGAAARSLRVRVGGVPAGAGALDTKVVVEGAGAPQVRWIRSGGSYLSQSEPIATFGLGDAGRAARVTVTWPDGEQRVFDDVPPGTLDARR